MLSGLMWSAKSFFFLSLGSSLVWSVTCAQNLSDLTNEREGAGMRGSQQQRWAASQSVHIFGAVKEPGMYYVTPGDRAITVIQLAGGLQSDASRTLIQLKRSSRTTKIINLIELNRLGDLSFNPILQEGDVIFVPRMTSSIRVQGAVKEPGVYEITRNTTLKEGLDMAYGFSAGFATMRDILIIRYDENDEKKTLSVKKESDTFSRTMLKDGDVVHVPHKFNSSDEASYASIAALPNDNISFPIYNSDVYVIGGVKLPGKFVYNPQHSLAKYVSLAGGSTRLGKRTGLVRHVDNSVTKVDLNKSVNVVRPGDIINMDESLLGPEFWITLMTTVASLGVTSYAILR